jgi:nucleoid-associated protein YgaU
MRRELKLLWAAGILLAGVLAALALRRTVGPLSPAPTPSPSGLSLRADPGPQFVTEESPAGPTVAPRGAAPLVNVASPLVGDRAPPAIELQYPRDEATESASGDEPPPADGAQAAPRTHRVRDGDTLALLAERYLGDEARAADIFAENRDRLATPDVLPIGLELLIPPRDGADTQ